MHLPPGAARTVVVLLLGAAALAGCGSGRKPPRPLVPSHWNRIAPQQGDQPRSRYSYALAIDDHRSRLVVFGGAAGPNLAADLWEWDGASRIWTNRTPQPLPAAWPRARLGHALAYDRARRRVLLFGGEFGMMSFAGDTWEWDPGTGTWEERTSAVGIDQPTPRSGAALAYDEARGRTFLWGGFDETGVNPLEAWEWDGQAGRWVDRTPSPLPAAWPAGRDGHSLVQEPVSRRALLFGGFDGSYLGDLWVWDGTAGTWASLTPKPLPPDWPAARHSAAIAFDRALDRVILFGGYDGQILGDLWEWHPRQSEWRERARASSRERWPLPRYGAAMAWDEARNRLLLFGGAGARGVVDESLWEWDGS